MCSKTRVSPKTEEEKTRLLSDLRPRIRINLWLYIHSEIWKNTFTGQKVKSHQDFSASCLWTCNTRNFPHDTDRGLCSVIGICVQFCVCLVYLLDFSPPVCPWTEPGSEEVSVNALANRSNCLLSGAVKTSLIMLFEADFQELIIQLLPQLIPQLQLLPQ